MRRSALLPVAFLLDQLAGDPEWFPHPVRGMGAAISMGERSLRRTGDSALTEFLCGVALTLGVVSLSYAAARALVRFAHERSSAFGAFVEVSLAWTCLASRNLQEEAEAVSNALENGNLERARQRLSRIVGRDTDQLDASEISRALIETLAESASDGVIAPMLYLALGGAPLAMAYKAINTLDSMIGHRDVRYLYFGRFAARLDDVANFLPSRLTALAIIGLSVLDCDSNVSSAWSTWMRDRRKHKSPNAGQPEAAMSGALRSQLGGDNRYAGELIPGEKMGEEFAEATPEKARQAIRVVARVALAGVVIGMLFSALTQREEE